MSKGTTELGVAYVSIVAGTEGFTKDVKKALGDLGGLGDEPGQKAGGGFGKSLLKGVGVAMATAGTAAVAGAAALVKGVVEEWGKLEQNLGGSEAVFGELSKAAQDAAGEAYKNMGLSASDYLQTLNKMGSLFQGSGISQAKSWDLSSAAMQRAADVASVMGVDMSMAMESVAGAAKGNFTMMDNLGVAMNAAAIEAYALEKGVNFKWDTATQAERSEVAIQMFMDRTSQYAGNFARESEETLSGAFGMMGASWQNFLAGLGNPDADMGPLTDQLVGSFGNIVNQLVPLVGRIVGALPGVVEQIAPAMVAMAPTLVKAVAELIPLVLDVIIEAMPLIIDAVSEVVPQVVAALIANLPKLLGVALQMAGEIGGGLVKGLGVWAPLVAAAGVVPVVTSIKSAVDKFKAFKADVAKVYEGFKTAAKTAQSAMAGLGSALSGVGNAFKTAGAAAKAGALAVGSWVKQTALATAAAVKSAAALVAQKVALIAQKVALVASKVATAVATAAQWLWNVAMSANPIGLIIVAVAALVAALVWFFTQTDLGREIWQGFVDFLAGAWEWIKGIAEDVWGAITGFFANIWTTIQTGAQALADWWANLWNGITEFFANLWDGILNFVKSVPDKVLGFLSGLAALPGKALEWFGGVLASAKDKLGEVVSWVKGIPGKILDSLGDIGKKLFDSGKALVQGFLDGIKAVWDTLTGWVTNGLEGLRKLWPFSPAEEGPFSGKGWVLYSGMSVGEAFGSGVVESLAAATLKVESAMGPMAGIFSQPAGDAPAADAGADLGALAGAPSITIQNMVVRDESDIRRIAQELARLTRRDSRAIGAPA
ncbi:MAG: hypothetical protein LBD77_02130 [Bifidobacteriaceae bacterium]|jgi:phage-related protein|nr:hypothetical protein [Bifidobacteriaceae bacterium]